MQKRLEDFQGFCSLLSPRRPPPEVWRADAKFEFIDTGFTDNGVLTVDCKVVDGKTDRGAWAYMCQVHYNLYGVGIGLGKGQAIIYKLAKADCGCCGLYADDDIE